MRAVSTTVGLSLLLACGLLLHAAYAEECELPFVVSLRPNQYLFIHGERYETVSMEMKTDPNELYVNSGLVCSGYRNGSADEIAPSVSPELKKFIDEAYENVPYFVRLRDQGVEKKSAVEMCDARTDSLLAMLGPLGDCYRDGRCTESDVAEQSAIILNDMGYRDVCESIEMRDGIIRARIHFVSGVSIAIDAYPPLPSKSDNYGSDHVKECANSLCSFASTKINIATMCFISSGGDICYLSGDDQVSAVLQQIEAAKQGAETNGPLRSAFVADFRPPR